MTHTFLIMTATVYQFEKIIFDALQLQLCNTIAKSDVDISSLKWKPKGISFTWWSFISIGSDVLEYITKTKLLLYHYCGRH